MASRRPKSAAQDEAQIASLDPQQERARLAKVQADRIELELAITRGELILAEDVERIVGSLALSVRSQLLAIPQRAAAKLATRPHTENEMATIIRREIENALEDLSTRPADIAQKCQPGRRPGARPVGASASDDREPLG